MSDEVRRSLQEAGLTTLAAAVEKGVRPALRVELVPAENGGALARSHLGGLPDLPPHATWPIGENNPMCFVGQIDLAEARGWEIEPAFPRSGLVSFFFSSVEPDGPYYPDARDEVFVVRFTPGSVGDLVRLEAPDELPDAARGVEHGLRFVRQETWPSAESATLDSARASDEVRATWARVVDGDADGDAGVPRAPVHRVLGHPRLLRPFDPRLECVLAAHDAYFHDFDERHPRYPVLLRERASAAALQSAVAARDDAWILLLQCESDARLGTCWGGTGGALSFWIHRDDLAAGHFDRAWCVKQSGSDRSREMQIYSY